MQNLPPDVLREIARRITMKNRRALGGTSRSLRRSTEQITDDITSQTLQALCDRLKLAFDVFSFMHKFPRSVFVKNSHPLHQMVHVEVVKLVQRMITLPRPFDGPKPEVLLLPAAGTTKVPPSTLSTCSLVL
jgi:hypothetical protein